MTPIAEPVWIRPDVVLAIHRRQLAEHGGAERIRDAGLLESALRRPRNHWSYGEPKPDMAALAAVYAHGIAASHPFTDGNKRTAYAVCRTFLLLNGWDLDAPASEKYRAVLDLARGSLREDELADWIRRHLRLADNPR